jgi:xanthosine phosphorylase
VTEHAHAAAAVAAESAAGLRPEIGLVLGSGLGPVADAIREPVRIPYAALPGFGSPTVAGHESELVLGTLGGQAVACLSGRSHLYEGATREVLATPIRTLALLGVRILLLTNASGSLRREVGPGSLVAVTDHINLLGSNPLTGPNDERFGPRFPSMGHAYDPELRTGLHRAAAAVDTPLHDGVYLATPGPSFETPAEIRAFRTLGADLVGMSTVPEVIVARHAGLRVAVVSVVTNLAEGLGTQPIDHEQTLRAGERGAAALAPLFERWLLDG